MSVFIQLFCTEHSGNASLFRVYATLTTHPYQTIFVLDIVQYQCLFILIWLQTILKMLCDDVDELMVILSTVEYWRYLSLSYYAVL